MTRLHIKSKQRSKPLDTNHPSEHAVDTASLPKKQHASKIHKPAKHQESKEDTTSAEKISTPNSSLASSAEATAILRLPEELASFLVKLGGLLLQFGSPVYRIEEVLSITAREFGCQCEVFAVPTGLWLSVEHKGDPYVPPVVRLIRVYGWEVDLERLEHLDIIFNRVIDRTLSFSQAQQALEELAVPSPDHPLWRKLLVTGGICGTSAFFFGGRWNEVFVGTFLGFLVVFLMMSVRNHHQTRLLIDFLVGCTTGIVVWIATFLFPDLLRKPMMLAGIVMLVPGMTLTVGLGELAHKQLVSGGARLLHAAMVWVSMVLGLAVAIQIESWWTQGTVVLGLQTPGTSHPLWLTGIITTLAGLAFADIFFVPKKYMIWAIGSCLVAWLASHFATLFLTSSPLAAFGSALTLGLYANTLTRITQKPGQIFLLPGLILLVPGTVGFLGFERFLVGDVAQGALLFFNAVMNAGGLIIGLILASATISPRKLL